MDSVIETEPETNHNIDNIDNLTIVNHRGIQCISTFPKELVWATPEYIGLGCKNCMEYATYKKVMIGLCINCADTYNGKYGSGYYGTLDGLNMFDNPVAFGNLNTYDVINKIDEIDEIDEIDDSKSSDIIYDSDINYSVFYLSIVSKNDIILLKELIINTIMEDYSCWYYFKDYYNCDDEVLIIILNAILKLKEEYEILDINVMFDKDYFKKCNIIETFYRVLPYEIEQANNDYDTRYNEEYYNYRQYTKTIKYNCNYCNIQKTKKELKKCGGCEKVNYCSIACQTHDWKTSHKKECGK